MSGTHDSSTPGYIPAVPHAAYDPDETQPLRTARPRRRRVARAVAGAGAVVLLAGGTSLVVDSAFAQGSSSSTVRTQDQQMPRSGPLYGGGGGMSVPQQQGTQQESSSQQAASSQVTGLVRIQTEIDFGQGEAAGTGMILSSDGEVVTNHHVVAGATAIKATDMSTGQTYTAKVVGTDSTDDVAVLQLQDASGLDTVKADTDGLSVGDAVTAVGDANGAKSLSAASGTVTALNRSITTQDEGAAKGEKLKGLIQVDADVISGDSGGATYDGEGEVVGMTTAASSGSANVTGYAIPIRSVLSIVDDLTSGVQSADYTYGYPAFLGVGLGEDGAVVAGVYDDTPAAKAGLEAGDTITSVDGDAVSSASQLSKDIAAHDAGDSIRITWTGTSGGTASATVTLADGPVA